MSFAALRRLRVCRIFREGRCGDLYRANVYLVHFQLRAKNVRTLFSDCVRLPDRGNSLVRLLRWTSTVDESSIQQRSAYRADDYGSP